MRYIVLLISTGFLSGYVSLASGTAGTMVGVFLFFLFSIHRVNIPLITVSLALAGYWAIEKVKDCFPGQDDPSEIVIDEIVGFLVAMVGINLEHYPFKIVGLAFLLFRIFDIWKPWLIRRVEKLPGAAGIMLDDILAGIVTNILVRIILYYLS